MDDGVNADRIESVSGRFPLVVDISGVVVPVATLAKYTTGYTDWPVNARAV